MSKDRSAAGGQPDEAAGESRGAGSIKRRHYIYHVVEETDQLIKIEELDEETQETREIPLPLAVSLGASEEEPQANAANESVYPEGYNPYDYSASSAPYGYGGYPFGIMLWIGVPPPGYGVPSPYSPPQGRSRASAPLPPRPCPEMKSFAATEGLAIGPRKAGALKFIDPNIAIGPRKAGSSMFSAADAAIGPRKAGGNSPDDPPEGSEGGGTFSPAGAKPKP